MTASRGSAQVAKATRTPFAFALTIPGSLDLAAVAPLLRVGITADTERIALNDSNTACERRLKSDVKHRFVIDVATLDA